MWASHEYPKPNNEMNFRDYLALFPSVPTGKLKEYFPDVKPHDISNFIKNNPHSEEYKNRGSVNGLTKTNIDLTAKNIKNHLRNFFKEELNISDKDFENGLNSEQVKKISQFRLSTNYSSSKKLGWISERYLSDEDNNLRKEKGYTLFYMYLKKFYPGEQLLNLSKFHAYYFYNTRAIKTNMNELLEAVKIYYVNHSSKFKCIRQFLEIKYMKDPESLSKINQDLWNYYRRSWRLGGSVKQEKWINTSEITSFGLNANMIKQSVEKYLNDLALGNDIDKSKRVYLLKNYKSQTRCKKVKLQYSNILHELLEIQECNIDIGTKHFEPWSTSKFLTIYPQFSRQCIGCGDIRSVDLHHINERSTNPESTYDENNVIPICSHVHNMITRKTYEYDKYLEAKETFNQKNDKSMMIEWVKLAHEVPSD